MAALCCSSRVGCTTAGSTSRGARPARALTAPSSTSFQTLRRGSEAPEQIEVDSQFPQFGLHGADIDAPRRDASLNGHRRR